MWSKICYVSGKSVHRWPIKVVSDTIFKFGYRNINLKLANLDLSQSIILYFLTETLNTVTFLSEYRHPPKPEGMRCGSKLTWHRSLSHHNASTPSHTYTHEEDDKGLCVISISGNFIQKEEEIPA